MLVQVAACVYIIATSGPALGLPIAFFRAVATYFFFDLFSGFVHYCLDWEGFNHIPFFGALCQTFQHHHKDTTFIWRSNIWSSVSEVGLFLHISDTLPLALFTYHKVHVPHIFWQLLRFQDALVDGGRARPPRGAQAADGALALLSASCSAPGFTWIRNST